MNMRIINGDPVPVSAELHRASLLSALSDPALDAISFLNEVIDRYPQAISFAPGAPFGGFLENIDIGSYLNRYIAHLVASEGLTPAQVNRRLYQYGPSRGLINGLLAQTLLKDEGFAVPPESIVVTVGAQEAMILVLRTLCPSQDDVLAVVNPSFVGIVGAAKVLGIATTTVDDTGDGLEIGMLERACTNARIAGKRIRALYVAPDYSNPAGSLLDVQQRLALLALAEREDLLLLEDNAYGFTAEFSVKLPTLKALDRSKRVIYLATCAKICLPGVRIGFVVANQPVVDSLGKTRLLADELAAVKSMITVNTSPICQAIVGGMILENDGSLVAIGQEKASLYRRNLSHLLDMLERYIPADARRSIGISWNQPKGGFFVKMQLPVVADEHLLRASARDYGVLWTPMSLFYLDGKGASEIRLSCSYLTLEEIEEGVQRLARFLLGPALSGLLGNSH